MRTNIWEERKEATHSDQASEDSFTRKDNKAGFQSQGGALPVPEDKARNSPGEVGEHPVCLGTPRRLGAGSVLPEHATGVLRKTDLIKKCLRSATLSWAPGTVLGSGEMAMNTKDSILALKEF